MPRFEPYIPQNLGEIMDMLAMMMLSSPRFIDQTGYFPDRTIDTIFVQLNEGLRVIREKLGEELYLKLKNMSDRMRAHFEADAENRTDETLKGRAIIMEMRNLLKPSARKT
jgi:hypothetical protein